MGQLLAPDSDVLASRSDLSAQRIGGSPPKAGDTSVELFSSDLRLLLRTEAGRSVKELQNAHSVSERIDIYRRRGRRAIFTAAGCPLEGRVCPPLRRSRSGMLALGQMQKWVPRIWLRLDMEPIGLRDSRHTAATWLDHAGVSPKVASMPMRHQVPQGRFEAAPLTLRRYTHVLPGELERARDQLDSFLETREWDESVQKACSEIPTAFPQTFPLTI